MSFAPPAIFINTVQATVLSATSNVLAQIVSAFRSGAPITLNTTRIFNFSLFTLLNTPPNVVWQDYLESTFPSKTLQPVVKHVEHVARAKDKPEDVQAASKEWVETVRMEKKLDVKNTLCKFVLDQTIGAFVNTMIFLAAMAALEGKGQQQIIEAVREQTMPLMLAGYKVWPLVSILQFTVVPPQIRIVVGCLVGVGWGIFLSLFNAH